MRYVAVAVFGALSGIIAASGTAAYFINRGIGEAFGYR